MTMRNTLLAATGLILLMVLALVFLGDGQNHGMLVSSSEEQQESIDDARKAFWAQDLPKAERIYRILTASDDATTNAWGELGNIYYMQSRWKEAANAYAEVAIRAIEKNDMRQAAFFHRLVSRMDQTQSERITKHLQSRMTKQKG